MNYSPSLLYIEFTINFFIIFAIFLNILLLTAGVFKTKNYSIELVLLGMISFCVLLGVHEIMGLTVTSYKLADVSAPFNTTIISKIFSLMAATLIFSVGVTKNRLQKFKLGRKD